VGKRSGHGDETLNAVLAYMPLVPNWAYNGAARRYFDQLIVTPRDGVRQGAFIAASGLWLTVDGGKIQSLI
jgi:hypothetical protein